MATLARACRVALLLTLAAMTLGACRQGLGDRCSIQADCAEGLLCILPSGTTPQSGGTCVQPAGQDGGTDDGGTNDASSSVDDLAGTD